jgi:diguanylate cyclase (GGDEF)-like protein
VPAASIALYLPVSFLLLQCFVLALAPAISGPAAYVVMVVAPLLAGIAALVRARCEPSQLRFGWIAVALALTVWALGAFGNLWQEWILGNVNEMYRAAMLAFNLASVPITFLLASEWRPGARLLTRVVDASLALALGYAYFLVTWTMITDRATPEEVGVAYLVWLIDVQSLVLAVGACVRWHVAESNAERDLFRALAVYSLIYLVLAFVNDHFIAGDPAFGPQYGSIITVAFAVLSAFALSRPSTLPIRSASPWLVRAVHSASPILLAGALLIVSLFLIRVDYAYGCAGVLIAVLGYGVRSTATQVRHIERGDALQQQRSELEAIAWTDGLTGVGNRHFLHQALTRAWRGERRGGRPLGILMIDIDYFKLLNDRYGHPAGDACLRQVAKALQHALDRADDILVRYGGEEFIALLRDVDAAGALIVGERLRAAVENMRAENLSSPFGVVTVSIGVASALVDSESSADRLVETADRALYQAKCAGRNQVRRLIAEPAVHFEHDAPGKRPRGEAALQDRPARDAARRVAPVVD